MAQLKATEVNRFVSSPDKNYSLILLYGPDNGLVSENVEKIISNLGFSEKGELSIANLEMDEIGVDPGLLFDEANAISMFGDKKLVFIQGSTRRNISPVFKSYLQNPPQDCWVIISSLNLKKDSAFRKLIENSKNAISLPCYQDNDASLNQLIDQEIISNDISLSNETRTYLRSFLGEDRRASRNELKKLAIYANNSSEITREQIATILGNVSSVANDDIIDAVARGNTEFLKSKLDQLFEVGTKPDILLLSSLRHFQMLHILKSKIVFSNASAASLVSRSRPPIHFSRRNTVVASLNNWSLKNLGSAIQRLNTAMLQARKNAILSGSISATTLLALSLMATRQTRT